MIDEPLIVCYKIKKLPEQRSGSENKKLFGLCKRPATQRVKVISY